MGGWRFIVDMVASIGHNPRVPNLAHWTPGMGSKALNVRERRASSVMETQRITLPARLVLDARGEAFALHDRIVRACASSDPADFAALPAVVGAAVKVRSQLLDLLAIPTRPKGEPRRRLLTLPPGDISDAEPLPPDPRTIPGAPRVAPEE